MTSKHVALTAMGLLLLTATACEQKMAHQPYYRPLEESDFFEDKRSSRPIPEGAIARGQLLTGDPLNTGLTGDALTQMLRTKGGQIDEPMEMTAVQEGEDPPANQPAAGMDVEIKPAPDAPSDVSKFVDVYPIEINEAALVRGAERYTIFCAACHGPMGNGLGKIQERGYLQPTSFTRDYYPVRGEPNEWEIRPAISRGFDRWGKKVAMNPYDMGDHEEHVPIGYYFEVITKGYGAMPRYASQIKPADRWKIIAYIRALQKNQAQGVELDTLSEVDAKRIRERLEQTEKTSTTEQ